MDMYQKRKIRAEKNNQEEKLNKVSINWYKPNYGKLSMQAYK